MSVEYAKAYAKLIGKPLPPTDELELVLGDGKKAIRDLIKQQKDTVKPAKKPKLVKKESSGDGKVKESGTDSNLKE
jgi:hypothetical protein